MALILIDGWTTVVPAPGRRTEGAMARQEAGIYEAGPGLRRGDQVGDALILHHLLTADLALGI